MWNAVRIYLAPPEGLFLNRVSFKNYNKKRDIPAKINDFNEEEEKAMLEFK